MLWYQSFWEFKFNFFTVAGLAVPLCVARHATSSSSHHLIGMCAHKMKDKQTKGRTDIDAAGRVLRQWRPRRPNGRRTHGWTTHGQTDRHTDRRLKFLRLSMIREERANLKLQPFPCPFGRLPPSERAMRTSTKLSRGRPSNRVLLRTTVSVSGGAGELASHAAPPSSPPYAEQSP